MGTLTLRGYSDGVAELSPRMVVVLRAASQGRTRAETALELHIAESTVASIRAAACARLGVSNVIQAVTVCVRAGVL